MDPVQDKNNQPLPVTPASDDPLEELTNLADDAYQVAMEETAKAEQMEADFAEYKKKFGESMGVAPKETPVVEVAPVAPAALETPVEPAMTVKLEDVEPTTAMDITPDASQVAEPAAPVSEPAAVSGGLADFTPAPDLSATETQPAEQVVGEVPTPPTVS